MIIPRDTHCRCSGPISLPVHQILEPPGSDIQQPLDHPHQVAINDAGWRCRCGACQRIGGDGFQQGDMEGRMDTERGRQTETHSTWVNDLVNLKQPYMPGGELPRGHLQREVLSQEPDLLARDIPGRRWRLACRWERPDAWRSTARALFQVRWQRRIWACTESTAISAS